MDIRWGDFDTNHLTNRRPYFGRHGNVDFVSIILEADKTSLTVELIALHSASE